MAHYTATVLDDRRLELPYGALSLARPGQEIEIDLRDIAAILRPQPNEDVLAMLRDVAELTKDIPETDPSQTNQLIREARAGAMYGYEPTE